MKMTRDEGSWSPEFWQASGSLGIDLNGLDISGTVDAAYLQSWHATVPGSVLTLPDIGSSNNLEETEDQTTDSTEENIDAASTRQSRRQARKQARLGCKRN